MSSRGVLARSSTIVKVLWAFQRETLLCDTKCFVRFTRVRRLLGMEAMCAWQLSQRHHGLHALPWILYANDFEHSKRARRLLNVLTRASKTLQMRLMSGER